MTVHVFKEDDDEVFYWTNVMPGDLVVSPRSLAFFVKDLPISSSKARQLRLANGLLLVIARIDGVICEQYDLVGKKTTFIVKSRHGS